MPRTFPGTEVAAAVGAALEGRLGYPYRALDWQTQNASLFSALQLEKLGMGVVIFCIILVAASNIVATLTMTVASKTREIGILQAMGLTRGAIGRIFLAQGAMIGAAGVSLGLALGLLVARAFDGLIRIDPSVYFIDRLPVRVEAVDVGLVILASFALAVLVTIFPSRRAARLEPVEAIRWE